MAMNKKPLFQSVFCDKWPALPDILKWRYSNVVGDEGAFKISGKMSIHHNWYYKLLSPFMRISGALVPYQGNDLPVDVTLTSPGPEAQINMLRSFYFPNRAPYQFSSRLIPLGCRDVIEMMRFGMGLRLHYTLENGKVTMRQRYYVQRLFGWYIPLPLSWIMGRAYAEEEAIGDNSFRMAVWIEHRLFGRLFDYRGTFHRGEA